MSIYYMYLRFPKLRSLLKMKRTPREKTDHSGEKSPSVSIKNSNGKKRMALSVCWQKHAVNTEFHTK